jgi:hypothetical protein
MNGTTRPPVQGAASTTTMKWSVGGLFLEALAQRDFDHMAECFELKATMRALLPYGPDEFQGSAKIVDAFRLWFGDAQDFEVLDGTVSDVGDRLHISWRLRLNPPPTDDEGWHVIEQQAYLRAGERIDALDLLCSGFMPAGRR